jgi:hypothetical protein
MARIARWFRNLCKFGVPLLVVLFIGSAIVDDLHRWSLAAAALRNYPADFAVLVGFNYRDAGSDWERSASYVLFPSLREITVNASSRSEPKVAESSFGLIGIIVTLAWLLGAIALSVWYWIRRPGRSSGKSV